VNDNVIKGPKSEGLRISDDIILRSSDKSCTNSKLLDEYTSRVLLPQIAKVQSDSRFTNKAAMRLIVNCSAHIHEHIVQTFAAHQVKMFSFQPHKANAFRCLNLRLFGVLKAKLHCELLVDSDGSVVVFIRRIFHNMKLILGPHNIDSTFIHIDI
jgi:hypothetical protein